MTPEDAARSFVEAEAELRQMMEASKRLDTAQSTLEAARAELARAQEAQGEQHQGAVRELEGAGTALIDAAAEIEHASSSMQEAGATLSRLAGTLAGFNPQALHDELEEVRAQMQKNGKLLVALMVLVIASTLILLLAK